MDADRFIDGSRLRWAHDSGCRDDYAVELVVASALADGVYRHQARNALCVHDGPVYKSAGQDTTPTRSQLVPGTEGFYLDADDRLHTRGRAGAPVYWEYEDDPNSDAGAYRYHFFYPYNDFRNLGWQVHEGDWEQVAVQVDGERPTAMVFWSHGAQQPDRHHKGGQRCTRNASR